VYTGPCQACLYWHLYKELLIKPVNIVEYYTEVVLYISVVYCCRDTDRLWAIYSCSYKEFDFFFKKIFLFEFQDLPCSKAMIVFCYRLCFTHIIHISEHCIYIFNILISTIFGDLFNVFIQPLLYYFKSIIVLF